MRGRWLLLLTVFQWVGCSDNENEKLLPCPPKGIAVEPLIEPSSSGGECTGGMCGTPGGFNQFNCSEGSDICEQVRDYALFDCGQPQICPDVGGADSQYLRVVLDSAGQAAPVNASFLLTNCSTGDAQLEIGEITLWGDERCAFSNVQLAQKQLGPGETTAIQVTYTPPGAGEDHLELRVQSNAQNFPVLSLGLCALTAEFGSDAGLEAHSCDAGVLSCLGSGAGCKRQDEPSTCP